MKNKTLLVLAAGVEQIPVVKIAHEMGLFVIVSDQNPASPAISYADDFIHASTYNIEETVDKVIIYNKKRKIDGIVLVGADVPLTQAHVAKELGIFGPSIETATLTSNKLLMKQTFLRDNIPIPWFAGVENFAELRYYIKNKNYDLIIKPVDSRGARGVLQLKHVPSLKWAYDYAMRQSPSHKLILEEVIYGPQVSTESIVLNGFTYTPGFIDRNYEYWENFAPFVIENGGEQPTQLKEGVKTKVYKLKEKATFSLGITKGVAKGDIVIDRGEPKIIEIASRLSGGYMSTFQIIHATGVNLIKVMINMTLGKSINPRKLLPTIQKGMAIRYWFPKNGMVQTISGEKRLKKTKWIKLYGFHVKPGEYIGTVTDHTKRAGFVITEGKSRLEAVGRAKKAISMVRFTTI